MKRTNRKKTPKVKGQFSVYCTYFPDGRFYIGFSTKTGKAYENYFGSSKVVAEYEGELQKETIAVFDKRSHARMQEFLLQWENRDNPMCVNDMINIRLRMSFLKDFEPIKWKPKYLLEEEVA